MVQVQKTEGMDIKGENTLKNSHLKAEVWKAHKCSKPPNNTVEEEE